MPMLPDLPDFDQSFLPIVDEAFRKHAAKVCTTFEGDDLTYADVDALSARVANALHRDGFAPGDLGAVYSANSAIAFVVALGIVRAGGVWVPLNPRNSPATNTEILSRFGCRALFHQPGFADVASRIAAATQAVLVPIDDGASNSLEQWLGDAPATPPGIERSGSDTMLLPQTGGTTGTPKGVMLSHRNFVALAWAGRQNPSNGQRAVLCAAPMTHVGGRAALVSLGQGVRLVILGTPDPTSILRTIERERITDVFLPPTAIYSLLDHPDTPTTDFSSLQRFAYGSAPISVPRLREAFAVFGPVMAGGFGQTESPISLATRPTADHFVDGDVNGDLLDDEALRSVGRETILSSVAIVDENVDPLPPGERGEIAVKGPMVFEGYYDDPAETAKVRRNGWHLTGDIGVLDEDGRLYVVDRKKDMIITGGFNVYSSEVEQALQAIDGVAEAAVIGVPSERWGEEVTAIVRLDTDAALSADDIIERAKASVGSVMAPKTVEIVHELPHTAVGKIDKKVLRAPYWAGTTRSI
ncbi:MAG: class I adenylate-forming enzyme family protein [Ilumatobacteraceae bacterium]